MNLVLFARFPCPTWLGGICGLVGESPGDIIEVKGLKRSGILTPGGAPGIGLELNFGNPGGTGSGNNGFDVDNCDENKEFNVKLVEDGGKSCTPDGPAGKKPGGIGDDGIEDPGSLI